MSELADMLDMDRTTLTRNLKPLIELRWVEVRPGEDDARVRLVRITRQERCQAASGSPALAKAQDEVNATIGPANWLGCTICSITTFRCSAPHGKRESE